jgi:hypothetical protein
MALVARLCVGPAAGPLRRQLDPTGWIVLEELLLCANDEGRLRFGVRTLAGSLGLDKDTVARALRRLRGAGLVELLNPGAYQVRVDRCYGLTLHPSGDRVGGCLEERDSPKCPRAGDGNDPTPAAVEADYDGYAKTGLRPALPELEERVESKRRGRSTQPASRTVTPWSAQPSLFDSPRPTSPAP